MMKWAAADRFTHVSFVGALVIVLLIVFQFITGSHMLSPTNLQNIVMSNAHLAVLAIGMIFVVTIGQLDLSIGSLAAFSSMCAALLLSGTGLPWWVGLLCGLIVGAFVGAIQGFIVAWFNLPAFIVTVAGMIVLRGGVQWGSAAWSIPVPHQFTVLGAGYLPSMGSVAGVDIATILVGVCCAAFAIYTILRVYSRRKNHGLTDSGALPWITSLAAIAGIAVLTVLFGAGRQGTSFPIPGLVVLVLVVIYHLLSTRTAFGRHVRAIGGNAKAAALSGVNVQKVQVLVMANMGFLAALAGIMYAGRSTAAGPLDGTSWELDVIAAVFIGGAAVAGGRGSVLGAVLGATLMAVLSNGLLLVGVGSAPAAVVKGLVLLVAVIIDAQGRRRADTGSQPKPSFTA